MTTALRGQERFAFEIVGSPPVVRVVKTPGVSARLSLHAARDIVLDDSGRPSMSSRVWYDIRSADFTDIPDQGSTLDIRRWPPVRPDFDVPWLMQTMTILNKLVVDVALGEIPVLGWFADAGELVGMVEHGTDRWGDEVSGLEMTLAGVGVVLPLFTGAGALTRAIRRSMGVSAEHLDDLTDALRRDWTDVERDELAVLAQIVASGRRLTAAQRIRAQTLLQKAEPCRA